MPQTLKHTKLPLYLQVFVSAVLGLLLTIAFLSVFCFLLFKNPLFEDYIPLILWVILILSGGAFGLLGGWICKQNFAVFLLSAVLTTLMIAGVSLLFGAQILNPTDFILRALVFFAVSVGSEIFSLAAIQRNRSKAKRSVLRSRNLKMRR